MRKKSSIEVGEFMEELEGRYPAAAAEYARQFAELPLSTQLAIFRRRQWLTQKSLARKLGVKQPHVARVENPRHDPRLSSLEKQARALGCHLVVVPDRVAVQVARLVSAA